MKVIKYNKYKCYSDKDILKTIDFMIKEYNENKDLLFIDDINILFMEAKKRRISLSKHELAYKIFYH